LGIIQFDAHADLRESYDDDPNSHASVARRLHEDIGTPLVQIGVRAVSPEEVLYRATASASKTLWVHDAAEIVPAGITEISIPDEFPPDIYITIDVDGLDPSVIPATGTPVPGGIPWYQFLSLLESVVRQRRVVGFDVVELAPKEGLHASDYGAAEIVYRTMGIITRAGAAGRKDSDGSMPR
jgi:agmatinase